MTAVAVAVVGGVFTLLTAVLAQNHKIRNESRAAAAITAAQNSELRNESRAAAAVTAAQNLELRKESKISTDALYQGMRVLMRNQLVNDHRHLSEKGFASVEELTAYTETHALYTALGGNGVVSHLVAEIRELKVQHKEG